MAAPRPTRTYVGAIDEGTTSTRFIVFDERGEVVGMAQKEITQHMPFQGAVEHDPEEIWSKTCEVAEEALARAGIKGSDLRAVGITNQRETTVVWNRRTGKPYCRAVVWMDMRAEPICEAIAAKEPRGKDCFREATGLPLSPYFSGTKIRWILDNVPGVREDALKGDAIAGTIDSWLLWKLSGGTAHLTDVTNASRYLLMDLKKLQWDAALCAKVGVPQQMLPTIVSSSQVYFKAASPACLAGVPVSGVLGDQQAALVGQKAFRPGMAKNTYGTGLFMLLNTGETPVASTHGLVTTVAYKLGPTAPATYALEGSVAIGGALVQWLRDNLGIISTSAECEVLARQVPDNGGVHIVPAFSGLYAPYWRPDARGVVCGLTRFADKRHFARAALEATAFQTLDVFEAMRKDAGGLGVAALAVDGGMTKSSLLLEFQAGVLNCPVVVPRVTETTALGAAYAAGLAVGVGVYASIADVERSWPGVEREFAPHMSESERDKRVKAWREAVAKTVGVGSWGGSGGAGAAAAAM